MNIIKRALVRFLIGFNIGMFINIGITFLCASLSGSGSSFLPPAFSVNFSDEITGFIVYIVISGVYGGIGIGATVFYEIESWSILRATASHFVLLVIAYFITAFTLRWFTPENIIEWVIMLVIFVVGYFIIWLVMFLSYKMNIKSINKELDEFKANRIDA